MNPNDEQWQHTQERFLLQAVLFAVIINLIVVAATTFSASAGAVNVCLGINLLYALGAFFVYRRAAPGLEKVFLVDQRKALQVMANVLKDNNVPFTRKATGPTFHLTGTAMTIRVYKERIDRHHWTKTATRIIITPLTPETKQRAFHLQTWLDDAFKPKGL